MKLRAYDKVNNWWCRVAEVSLDLSSYPNEKIKEIIVCRDDGNRWTPGNTGQTIKCKRGANWEVESHRPGGYFQDCDPRYQWYTRPLDEFDIVMEDNSQLST